MYSYTDRHPHNHSSNMYHALSHTLSHTRILMEQSPKGMNNFTCKHVLCNISTCFPFLWTGFGVPLAQLNSFDTYQRIRSTPKKAAPPRGTPAATPPQQSANSATKSRSRMGAAVDVTPAPHAEQQAPPSPLIVSTSVIKVHIPSCHSFTHLSLALSRAVSAGDLHVRPCVYVFLYLSQTKHSVAFLLI
jgi:hypothetical protein